MIKNKPQHLKVQLSFYVNIYLQQIPHYSRMPGEKKYRSPITLVFPSIFCCWAMTDLWEQATST